MLPSFLTGQEARVYEVLDTNPLHVEAILQKLQHKAAGNENKEELVELQDLMWTLLQLCIKGVAKQVGTGSYVKILLGIDKNV